MLGLVLPGLLLRGLFLRALRLFLLPALWLLCLLLGARIVARRHARTARPLASRRHAAHRLRRRQRRRRMARLPRGDGCRRPRRRRGRALARRSLRRPMRIGRDALLEAVAAGGGRRRRDDRHVAHVGDVGRVVRDVVAVVLHVAVHAHAHVDDRRRADDHARRRADRRRHDDARTRARRRRDEHALRAIGMMAGMHAHGDHGRRDGDAEGRRDEAVVRRRPVRRHVDDLVAAMLVVRLLPGVVGMRRARPAARAPHPAPLPGPVAAGPHAVGIRRRRHVLHQHRRRRPVDGHRRRLLLRRIDVDADDLLLVVVGIVRIVGVDRRVGRLVDVRRRVARPGVDADRRVVHRHGRLRRDGDRRRRGRRGIGRGGVGGRGQRRGRRGVRLPGAGAEHGERDQRERVQLERDGTGGGTIGHGRAFGLGISPPGNRPARWCLSV